MKVVVLGSTRGIGRAIARELAGRGDAVFLLGRNQEDLARSAADLDARCATPAAGFARCDLEEPASFLPALEAARDRLGGLDAIVLSAGLFGTQEDLESDPELRGRMLTVNFTNTILFCEVARPLLLADGGGTLCVLSSVAGERPRKPVVLYGAAKAGLSYYLEGLDYRFSAQGLRTLAVKPGFVRTGMTAQLRPPPFATDAEPVARAVVRALDGDKTVLFVPAIWWWVMALIRKLPRFVMRRLSF